MMSKRDTPLGYTLQPCIVTPKIIETVSLVYTFSVCMETLSSDVGPTKLPYLKSTYLGPLQRIYVRSRGRDTRDRAANMWRLALLDEAE